MSKPFSSDAITAARQLGGVVLFEGGNNPLKAGPGAILSWLIKLIAKTQYSHSAVLMPDGKSLYQCTIEGKLNGPQLSNLDTVVAGYGNQGGHAWLFNFAPQFTPDWNAVDVRARQLIDMRVTKQLNYSVPRLFADAAERSWVFDVGTLPFEPLVTYLAAHDKGMVCSEEVGFLLEAGGVATKVRAAGLPWLPTGIPPGQSLGDSPQDFANMPQVLIKTVQLV